MGGTIMNIPDMMLIYYCYSYHWFMADLTIFSYLHLYDTSVLPWIQVSNYASMHVWIVWK